MTGPVVPTKPAATSPPLPLDGVRVLDFGQYVAGPMAATLLADSGATVVRIERPEGPMFKDPGNAYLLRGRQETHRLDLKTAEGKRKAFDLIDRADIVIENFRPGKMQALGLGADVCLARNSSLIYCSLPAFSERDERAHLAGWEGVVLAQGGAFAAAIKGSDFLSARAATMPGLFPLPLASCFAATMTALAATAALIARAREGGAGQRIEVPLSDALLEGSSIASTKIDKRVGPDPLWALVPGLYRSRDQQILCLSTTVFRHLTILAEAAGRHDLIESGLIDFDYLRADPEHAAKLRAELVTLFATRDGAEWEALLGEAGVPISMHRTTRQWLRDPVAVASECVVAQQDAVHGRVRTLGAIVDYDFAEGPARTTRSTTSASAPPLTGFKVIDLSRVVAAPTAARLLADLGAEVIKIDSDPAQRQTSVTEPLGHVYMNRGKRGAILNLKDRSDWAVFAHLLGGADALVTNVSKSRLEPLGLGEHALSLINPELVISYLNMHGFKGPMAAYRGYAGIADSVTGLPSLTTDWQSIPSGGLPPSLPPWPHTDSVAGILGAFATVAALFGRSRNGRRYRAMTSLTRTSLLEQMPYAVDGPDIDPARGRKIASLTYRLYAAKDGLLFAAIHADDVAEALDRLGLRSECGIEAALEAAIAERSVEACANLLSFNRSSVVAVRAADYTMEADSPWARRGLLLTRQSEDFGVVVTHGPVIRFSRTPVFAGATPRAFGTERPTEWF